MEFTSFNAMRTAWKNASRVSCAPPPARLTASTSKLPRTPKKLGSAAASGMQSVYNIDYSRCIFCGYCVEACPTDAITHGHAFEIASFNTSTLVYRKEQLLAPIPGRRQRLSDRGRRSPDRTRPLEPLQSLKRVFGFDSLQIFHRLGLHGAVDRDALLGEPDRVMNTDALSRFGQCENSHT